MTVQQISHDCRHKRSSQARVRKPGFGSLELFQQLPGLTKQSVGLFPLFDRLLGEYPVLERVLISFRCTRPRGTPVHSASLFVAHRRRATSPAGAGPGAATGAVQHGAGVALVIAPHFLDFERTRTTRDCRSSIAGMGVACPSVRSSGEGDLGGFCVTLPTIAWPP